MSVAVGKDGPATPRPEGGSRVEDGDAPDGYENLTRIDQGGFAVVYRGRDTRFDRTVALKILRSDSLGERQLRRDTRTRFLLHALTNLLGDDVRARPQTPSFLLQETKG